MEEFVVVDNDEAGNKLGSGIPEDEKINYLNFSPNFRSIWIGRGKCYQIFDFIDNRQDTACKRVGEDCSVGNVRIICENPQRYNKLFCLDSSPSSVIGSNLQVIPLNKLAFKSAVLDIFYGEKVVVFVTNSAIYSYDITSGCKSPVSSNRRKESVAAFSDESNSFAFFEDLSDISNFNILIYDVKYRNIKKRFSAFNGGLVQLLALNKDGTLLAAIDGSGLNIHVHNVQDGGLLYTFIQKYHSAKIQCMNFSLDSKFILVISDEGHMNGFNLEISGIYNNLSSSFWNFIGKAEGKFMYGHLPVVDDSFTKVCLATVFSLPRVVVLSSKGYIYYFEVDLINGGEMKLAREYTIPSNE